ncbi:MAG: hypothetical protein IJS26_04375 [Alphaproteobacteria bacterium]|nr:hypothetical protein [Alphaproteobacteria bacterium]
MVSVIGMVRYSVAASFAFPDRPDVKHKVFEDPYFSQRLAMFKGITLKSFAGQTCKDFVLLVYHSAAMPEDKKAIFAALEREYPFMKNIYIDGAKQELPQEYQRKRIMTFRIDNDDAMPADFVGKLKEIYESNNPMYDNVAFSVAQMRRIAHIAKDKYLTNTCFYISNSMGLAYLSTNGQNVMDCGNHARVIYCCPMMCLEGQGGLRVISGTNVANNFCNPHHKQTEPAVFDEQGMREVLQYEGYTNMDIQDIPILPEPC